MASSLEHLLTCDVCLDTYDKPKLLPACAHVFCKKCLSPLVRDDVITCPKCRKASTVLKGGLNEFNTDRNLEEMIGNFKCSDCASIDKFAKKCDECYMNMCPTCIQSHESLEKCELLTSIRDATNKLPTTSEWQKLDGLETEWQKFRDLNQKQKSQVNEIMIELIKSLQGKKAAMLKKFDEYDQFAEDMLEWMKKLKETEVHLKDFRRTVTEMKSEDIAQAQASMKKYDQSISKKKDLLTKLVPHPLSVPSTDRLGGEIGRVGRLITRRQAGKDVYPDVMWSAKDASLREESKDGWSSKQPVQGNIQVRRHRSGRYELRVLDAADRKKILKTFEWNTDAADAQTPTLITSCWTHVPWDLKTGGKTEAYSTRIEDEDDRADFADLLEQARYANTQ